MQFTLKTTVLFGLLATTFALPGANPNDGYDGYEGAVQQLDTRMAKIPDFVICGPEDKKKSFNRNNIYVAIQNSHSQHGKYPERFYNKEPVFDNQPPDAKLWEYPLVDKNGGWTSGEPGPYRVVMKDNFNYVGCMYHVGGQSGGYKKCVSAPLLDGSIGQPPLRRTVR